jgi:hypothetical protein
MKSATLPDNRRAFARRSANGKVSVTCHKGTAAEGPDLAIALGDVSESGLRLRVKEPLPKWQDVTIGLAGNGDRPLQLTGTVVWSEPADEAFLVGIHLAKQIPASEIQQVT